MSITFYDFSMAPSPRRARILLAEKGVPHDTVIIDLGAAEQLGDAYRAINPSCTVPALKLEDGTVLTENAGIAAYLEAAYPNPPMLGVTAEEKGLVANWVAKVEFEGFISVADALRNSAPLMKDRALTGPTNWAQISELAERGLLRLRSFFEMLDVHLEGREYVAIDDFSYADIVAAVVVDFSRVVKVVPEEKHKNLRRWREQLNQRPSMAL